MDLLLETLDANCRARSERRARDAQRAAGGIRTNRTNPNDPGRMNSKSVSLRQARALQCVSRGETMFITTLLTTIISVSTHPELGIAADTTTEGVIITAVAAGSPAAPYVKNGDRILSINGETI